MRPIQFATLLFLDKPFCPAQCQTHENGQAVPTLRVAVHCLFGGMKSIALLESKVEGELSERLKTETIPVKVRTVRQDSGLDFSEILVEDSDYERACNVAEAWQAERDAEAEKRSKRHCPKCGSGHLDYVWLDNLTPSAKCKDCGHEFLP